MVQTLSKSPLEWRAKCKTLALLLHLSSLISSVFSSTPTTYTSYPPISWTISYSFNPWYPYSNMLVFIHLSKPNWNGISSIKPFAAAAAKSLQSCLTLCDSIDVSPAGYPVSGILQARILGWVAISFSNIKPFTNTQSDKKNFFLILSSESLCKGIGSSMSVSLLYQDMYFIEVQILFQ